MRYIDNLVAWGDSLFRQNTLESINEATLMYVLASELLGPRHVTYTETTGIVGAAIGKPDLSYRLAPAAINSMAQQASPMGMGQTEFLRNHARAASTVVSTTSPSIFEL